MKRLTDLVLRMIPRRGLDANINSNVTKNTAYGGELHYTEDKGRLYHYNGVENVLILTQNSDGSVVLSNLPTSPSGLPSGTLWVDGDILKVTP